MAADTVYATPAELRAEGLVEPSDARLTSVISIASRYVDRATGLWFVKRSLTLPLDGSGTPTLDLPAPALALTAITIDEGPALDPSDYVNYNRRPETGQEDFWWPRLLFQSTLASRYERAFMPRRSRIWSRGEQNVVLVGDFGFVDAGDATPAGIKRLVTILAIALAPMLASSAGRDLARAQAAQSETFGNYSYTKADSTIVSILSGNLEAARLLDSFRRVAYVGSA